jgi:hypothetical protein
LQNFLSGINGNSVIVNYYYLFDINLQWLIQNRSTKLLYLFSAKLLNNKADFLSLFWVKRFN